MPVKIFLAKICDPSNVGPYYIKRPDMTLLIMDILRGHTRYL